MPTPRSFNPNQTRRIRCLTSPSEELLARRRCTSICPGILGRFQVHAKMDIAERRAPQEKTVSAAADTV